MVLAADEDVYATSVMAVPHLNGEVLHHLHPFSPPLSSIILTPGDGRRRSCPYCSYHGGASYQIDGKYPCKYLHYQLCKETFEFSQQISALVTFIHHHWIKQQQQQQQQ